MALSKELVAVGMHTSVASAVGGSVETGITAAGASQATAYVLTKTTSVVGTAAASTGVLLPSGVAMGDELFVRNGGANALAVYPPVGGTINGGSANAALSVATLKTAVFKCVGATGLDFIAVVSA